jgi:RNA-directed DNA polymerase
MSHNPNTNACGESDSAVVLTKCPNKGAVGPAEGMEGRALAKKNHDQASTCRTQSRESVSQGLAGVRQAARQGKGKKVRFTALMHHITVELLRLSYALLRKDAAAGVDGVSWEQYGRELESRLKDLHERIHRGGYRAQPSRRVYIRKEDGRQRPLGIATLEDKIVQQAVVTVLNLIYEEEFQGFSYGFRPGRNQHQALDALNVGLRRRRINWVLDCDIRGFFDNVKHEWMMQFVEHRIADPRMLRLIQKWLKAGVIENEDWMETEAGTPQGAVVSPLLANVYLHHVFDLWVAAWRRKCAKGDMIVVRYADDIVIGFQHRAEAERFWRELGNRVQKFGLELHPEKTRLIEFGRFAKANREQRGEGKPETFSFLGFTHYCAETYQGGYFTVRRKTIGKRLRAKLREIEDELRKRWHEPIEVMGKWLRSVIQGYFRYHAVPGNFAALTTMVREVTRAWLRALRRRSQRDRFTWQRFRPIVEQYIPRPRILHPEPGSRFDARIQGRSRMH